MAYMFDCSPAGTPTRRISPSRRPWKRTCFQSSRYTVSARVSDTSTSTALTPWEKMVAKAAPSTPMPSIATSTTSRAMFTRHAMMRKYSGRRVSPTARRMPEPTLYKKDGMVPSM